MTFGFETEISDGIVRVPVLNGRDCRQVHGNRRRSCWVTNKTVTGGGSGCRCRVHPADGPRMRWRRISGQRSGQRSRMEEERGQRRSRRRTDQSLWRNHRHRWSNKRRSRGTQRWNRSAFRYRFGVDIIQRRHILFQ